MWFAACAVAAVTLCLLLIAGVRFRHVIGFGSENAEISPCPEVSVDFYRPMERLLDERDFLYAASNPGITPQAVSRMRTERRRIFRKFLCAINGDFARLTTEIRLLIVHSQESRGDLAMALFRARVIFAAAVLAVECRLLLHATGLHGIQISVQPLISGLNELQDKLALLNPLGNQALAA